MLTLLMKHPLITLLLSGWLITLNVFAQERQSHADNCSENPFETTIHSVEYDDTGCARYTVSVSYNETCKYALSHYVVAASCGTISLVENSEGWKQESGYDKTTGLQGVKVDDIPEFGNTSLKQFTVTFTLCAALHSHKEARGDCGEDHSTCCYPIVGYKAGQCVYFDKLDSICADSNPDSEIDSLFAAITKTDASCISGGSLQVTVSGGEAPYSYQWSGGDTTSVLTGVPAGTYQVVVTDAAGQEVILEETISQVDGMAVAGTVVNESCEGTGNGAIDITVSGGSAPYTYIWNTGAVTEDLDAIGAGDYTVSVSDSLGCSAEQSFTILSSDAILISAEIVQPACSQINGGFNITVSGGTAPYSYLWSTGATTEDIDGLGAGAYSIIVKDAAGCKIEDMYSLTENNTLKLSAMVTQTTCLDDGSGAIDLAVQGGAEPNTYTWSNGETSEDLSGLTAGIYSVTVLDGNGCSKSLRVSVTKETFQVSEQVTQPSCDGSQGGAVTVTPLGVGATYTYVWSTGATTAGVTDLAAGIYTVTITDATGCSRTLVYVINDLTAMQIAATVTNAQCSATDGFSIDASVSGGTAPYTYAWSTGDTTEDLNSLAAGTYVLTVTDASGCSATQEVIIEPIENSWDCLIADVEASPECGLAGYTLSATLFDADSYTWTVMSSDGQWVLTAGTDGPSVTYTTGSAGSSATFTLTIIKDGCTQTCSYTITTCEDTSDDDGSDDGGDDDGSDDGGDDDGNDDGGDNDGSDDVGDDDGSDDGGDDDCDDCMNSEIVSMSAQGSCHTYTVKVNTNGLCRHELSHWTVSIPCGEVSNYTNSEGWPMSYGKDPTTGIYGLKVDDISRFANTADSFTVSFTVCAQDEDCMDDWDGVVAYKAGQCVAYDTLHNSYNDGDDSSDGGYTCKAYPNPFHDNLAFEWTATRDEHVCLDVYDFQGHYVKCLYKGDVKKGESYKVNCDGLSGSFYFYRFNTGGKIVSGKLCKTR